VRTRRLLFSVFALTVVPCWAAHKHTVKVETTPPDALVSVYKSEKPARGESRVVAGATPLTKEFDFGKAGRLWLEFEKRGYVTQKIEITPDKDTVSVTLERFSKDGVNMPEYKPPTIKRLAIATDAQVYHHAFTKESSSPEESRAAAEALAHGLEAELKGKRDAVLASGGAEDAEALKPVWRDVNGAFELIDPIRLRYLPARFLETRSALGAVRKMGERTGADALLLISLRQTTETKGMVIGKTAILTGGTVASYSGGYANAAANHQTFFVYNVYLPSFSQGATVNSVLVDCRTGEILWANRGIWKPLHFDNPPQLKEVANDLLIGMP
jgi:hypothetical protein